MRILHLLFTLFVFEIAHAQVLINYDVDTTLLQISKPVDLWVNFLQAETDREGAIYWNSEEIKKYGQEDYFLIKHFFNFGDPDYLKSTKGAKFTLLQVREVDGFYKLSTLMEFKPWNEKANVQYVFHVYAKEENGTLKLYNALTVNTQLYLTTKVNGNIVYHFPPSHQFDEVKAQKQNDFLIAFAKNFKVSFDTVHYYFAPTSEEIDKIKGFDFKVGNSGKNIPGGYADYQRQTVYTTGLGEYYPHEIIHLLINPHYPNCHGWINEGVATYFGMSRGKSLDWHLNNLKQFVKTHPEVDFNNMLALRNLDAYTGYRYVLGGLIVKRVYEKGGYALLIELMNAGKTDDDFYGAIKTFLGVEPSDLNTWVRTELEKFKF